ncbi:MAG: gidB [Nitrospira sp.]|nr:gidB [Nitrospira sp.]
MPDSAVALFSDYLQKLKEWNKAINLTTIRHDHEIVVKHFVDSLAGLKVIEITEETQLLDVGAGAGFPGLPIKFVRPDFCLKLLEPNEKRGSFLRYVSGSLGLPGVSVATVKLEDYAKRESVSGLYDYIVVRAFKVDKLGSLLGRLLKDGGKLVLYRASRVGPRFRLDNLILTGEVEYELPAQYGHRTLSVFSKQAG